MTNDKLIALEAVAEVLWQELKTLEGPYEAKRSEWSDAYNVARQARLEYEAEQRVLARMGAPVKEA